MQEPLQKWPVVNFINQNDLENLRMYLHQNGFRIFELDGSNVKDGKTLFRKAGEQLPQEPKLAVRSDTVVWDALVDSLWGGLAELNDEQVAFIWLSADKMLERGLPELTVAIDCFTQLASQVARTEHGFPHQMLLRVFLVGEGPNFRPIPQQRADCDDSEASE